jgi:predicted O-methyltransferase YrrM
MLLAALRAERPSFHHAGFSQPAGSGNWAISDPVLEWLAHEMPAGGTTLETGAGYSTVLFAAKSARHIAISFTPDEMRLIAAWCGSKGLGTAHVAHHAGGSQKILPSLELPVLDCVLIDGDHAFPAPMIDWYYTADRLKPGGLLLNDDLHLRSCLLLDQFLEGEAEAGRWRRLKRLKNTSVWQRLTEASVHQGHADQPFAREWSPQLRARLAARRLKRRLLGRPVA